MKKILALIALASFVLGPAFAGDTASKDKAACPAQAQSGCCADKQAKGTCPASGKTAKKEKAGKAEKKTAKKNSQNAPKAN